MSYVIEPYEEEAQPQSGYVIEPYEDESQDTAGRIASTIKQVETGGDYSAKGASGEFGAYQFMPDTWAALSSSASGGQPVEPTPENQDSVAIAYVQQLLDAGHTAEQIASIWNSGSPEWEGKVGTNQQGVQYDVPGYVGKFNEAYGGGGQQQAAYTIEPYEEEGEEPGLVGGTIASAARGGVEGFNMWAKTADVMGLNAEGVIDWLDKLGEPLKQKSDGVRGDWYQGVESVTQSLVAGIPGVPLGVAGVGAATLTAFGMSQYYDFLKEAGEFAESVGVDPEKFKEQAKDEALFSAFSEAAPEALSSVLAVKIFGLLGKTAKGPVKKGIDQFVKRYLSRTAKMGAVEVPTEMTTAALQSGARTRAGMPSAPPMESALQVVRPTMFATALFGILGSAGGDLRQEMAGEVGDTGAGQKPGFFARRLEAEKSRDAEKVIEKVEQLERAIADGKISEEDGNTLLEQYLGENFQEYMESKQPAVEYEIEADTGEEIAEVAPQPVVATNEGPIGQVGLDTVAPAAEPKTTIQLARELFKPKVAPHQRVAEDVLQGRNEPVPVAPEVALRRDDVVVPEKPVEAPAPVPETPPTEVATPEPEGRGDRVGPMVNGVLLPSARKEPVSPTEVSPFELQQLGLSKGAEPYKMGSEKAAVPEETAKKLTPKERAAILEEAKAALSKQAQEQRKILEERVIQRFRSKKAQSGEVVIPGKKSEVQKLRDKMKPISSRDGEALSQWLKGKQTETLQKTARLDAAKIAKDQLVEGGAKPETVEAITSLIAKGEVSVDKVRNIWETELAPIPESPLDMQADVMLRTGDAKKAIESRAGIGPELTLTEVLKYAKDKVAAVRKSGFFAHREVANHFWHDDSSYPAQYHAIKKSVLEQAKKNKEKLSEFQAAEYAANTYNKNHLPEGKPPLVVGQKLEDVTRTAGTWMDPTRLLQAIDGGLQGGPLSKYVLWPARKQTIAKILFTDMQKVKIAELQAKYKIKGKNRDKLASDVIEELSKEDAELTVDAILGQNTKIAEIVRQLPDKAQRELVGYAKEVRGFLEELRDLANLAREKRNQPLIGYQEKYISWIRDRGILANFLGELHPADVKEGTIMPDFMKPNQPFNPHAQKRVGNGEWLKERRSTRLLTRYVDAMGRDIFDTDIIHNNKVHAKLLREMGYENAATHIENWTNESFAGVDPRFTKFMKSVLPEGVRSKMLAIRSGLTRAVFPLNWTWNLFIQTSSVGLTFMRYGPVNCIYGLSYFTNPTLRNAVQHNAYSLIIKKRWGGSQLYQDLGESITRMRKLESGPIDTVTSYASFLTEVLEDALTGHAITAALRHGKKKGLSGRALWEYGSDGGAKTQSMYNKQDLPGALRSRDLTALVPFQTFAFEVFNTVREMNLPVVRKYAGKAGAYEDFSPTTQKRMMALGRWAVAIMITNAVVDKVLGREPWEFSSFVPFSGLVMPSARAFDGKLLPAQYMDSFFRKGVAKYIRYGDWSGLRTWFLRYHMTGGIQFNRMMDGLEAVAEGKVTDVRGRKKYRVGRDEELTAVMMGPSKTKEGKKYHKAMKEKQGLMYKWFSEDN